MTKRTGIGFNKLSNLGKYNNKNEFEDGDIYFKGERDKVGDKQRNSSIFHALMLLKDYKPYSDFDKKSDTYIDFSEDMGINMNPIIYDTTGYAHYDVIRYIGPKKKDIIKNVIDIINEIWKKERDKKAHDKNVPRLYKFTKYDKRKAEAVTGLTATKQKQIDKCLKKMSQTDDLISSKPKFSKFLPKVASINRYNKSLSNLIVSNGKINWDNLKLPYTSANCTEFLLMIWYIAIGTINKKIESGKLILDEEFLDDIMPIHPHRCTKLGLLELCKIRPLYWKKITLKNIYMVTNYQILFERQYYLLPHNIYSNIKYSYKITMNNKGVKNFKGIVSIKDEEKGKGTDPIRSHAKHKAYEDAYTYDF